MLNNAWAVAEPSLHVTAICHSAAKPVKFGILTTIPLDVATAGMPPVKSEMRAFRAAPTTVQTLNGTLKAYNI